MYKDHARAFLGRVNSINGRTYSQDDTILGETCGSAAPLTAVCMAGLLSSLPVSAVIDIMSSYAVMDPLLEATRYAVSNSLVSHALWHHNCLLQYKLRPASSRSFGSESKQHGSEASRLG